MIRALPNSTWASVYAIFTEPDPAITRMEVNSVLSGVALSDLTDLEEQSALASSVTCPHVLLEPESA